MTRVALIARKKEIVQETPNFNARKFRYYLSRAAYQKEWGKGYRQPGFGTRLLAIILMVVPKVGPFKALDFKIPTKTTEDLYIASVDKTVENYRQLLHDAGSKDFHLANMDFDTGKITHAGEYRMTDDAYARLLNQFAQGGFAIVSVELRQNILDFYSDPNAPLATKRNPADWKKMQDELQQLKDGDAPPAAHQPGE
jgi:hypothetical protein